ncbi:MAG: ATP-binding protein [Endomicrobium sp.]|uniref:hypothetical protein n=1 Tax=Candidatus Endomicrobiellum cubanum TaxID=3242325 RepID=UPI0028399DE9|nr:ATP-binding protein [Endomicrobium sp.]
MALLGINVIIENSFWSKIERKEYKAFYGSKGIPSELHYIDTPQEQRTKNIKKRNKEIANGLNFFLVQEESDINHFFEEPSKKEADVWVKWLC